MCFSFVVLKIGCDQTNSVQINTDILNSVTNTISQNAVNNSEQGITSVQTISVSNNPWALPGCTGSVQQCVIPAKICCPQLSLVNTLDKSIQILNKFNADQVTQLQTQMASQVQNETDQKIMNGFLNFLAQNGNETNSTELTQHVSNVIKNSINQSLMDNYWTGISENQAITINNNGGTIAGSDCELLNESLLNLRITNVSKALQRAIASDSIINQMINYSNQTGGGGNEFGDLLKLIALIVAGFVGLIVFIIIIFVIVKLFKGSENS